MDFVNYAFTTLGVWWRNNDDDDHDDEDDDGVALWNIIARVCVYLSHNASDSGIDCVNNVLYFKTYTHTHKCNTLWIWWHASMFCCSYIVGVYAAACTYIAVIFRKTHVWNNVLHNAMCNRCFGAFVCVKNVCVCVCVVGDQAEQAVVAVSSTHALQMSQLASALSVFHAYASV